MISRHFCTSWPGKRNLDKSFCKAFGCCHTKRSKPRLCIKSVWCQKVQICARLALSVIRRFVSQFDSLADWCWLRLQKSEPESINAGIRGYQGTQHARFVFNWFPLYILKGSSFHGGGWLIVLRNRNLPVEHWCSCCCLLPLIPTLSAILTRYYKGSDCMRNGIYTCDLTHPLCSRSTIHFRIHFSFSFFRTFADLRTLFYNMKKWHFSKDDESF